MASLNRCEFIGNLGSDPDVRYTQAGTEVSNFSIACNEKYKNKNGEMVEHTEWVNITAWGKLSEICSKYLHKGDKVYIAGPLKTEKWEDKDGNTRYTTKVNARELVMLGSKGGSDQQHERSTQGSQGEQQNIPADFDDDIPFN